MIALYILGGIILLLLLLLSLRLGIRVEFGQALKVDARIGPCRISVLPKAEKNRSKSGKKTENSGTKTEKKTAAKPAISLQEIRSAMPAVWESLQRGLRKTRRKIRIEPLSLCLNFGGEDPAEIAEWYGWANSTLWTVMPALQEKLQIPNPQIHLGVDFNAPKTAAQGEIGIRCRIGGLIAIVSAFAKPLLQWLLTNRKQKKRAEKLRNAEPKSTDNKAA